MGFSYKGSHSDSYSLIATDVRRGLSPSREHVTVNIPAYNGLYPLRLDDQGRIIDVRFALKGTSFADVRSKAEEAAGWLSPERDQNNAPIPSPLVFDDALNRRWMAYPVGRIDMEEILYTGMGLISFACPAPYAEATIWKQVSGKSGTNEGSVETPPWIEVTVTNSTGITDLKIELDNSDKYLLLEGAFAQNEVIVFDASKRMVTVDGVDARGALHYNRRWFNLYPGSYSLTTVPASGIDVEVFYKERWL